MKLYSGNISNALSEKNSFLTFPKSCFRPIDFSQKLLDEKYLTETSCDMLVVFWNKYKFCKGIPNSESLLAAPACLQIKVIEQIEFPPKKTKLQKKASSLLQLPNQSALSEGGQMCQGKDHHIFVHIANRYQVCQGHQRHQHRFIHSGWAAYILKVKKIGGVYSLGQKDWRKKVHKGRGQKIATRIRKSCDSW